MKRQKYSRRSIDKITSLDPPFTCMENNELLSTYKQGVLVLPPFYHWNETHFCVYRISLRLSLCIYVVVVVGCIGERKPLSWLLPT